MSASNLCMNNILNYNFGAQAYSPSLPANMYFGLSLSLIDAADVAITDITEVTGTSYGRVPFSNNKTNWSISTATSLTNNIIISFPQSGGVWSTDVAPILSVFITDTSSGAGNIWWYHTLTPSLVVPNNMVVSFPIESVIVTEGGLAATTFTLNHILNYNFGSTAYDPDGSGNHLYFGLSLTKVTASGITSATEPSESSGYARVAVDNNKTTWTTSSGTPSLNNDIDIVFPISTTSWGTMLSIFIADLAGGSEGAGNILWYKTLEVPILIQKGTVYTIPATTGFAVTTI